MLVAVIRNDVLVAVIRNDVLVIVHCKCLQGMQALSYCALLFQRTAAM